MLHTPTEEAVVVASITPNGKTIASLEQTGFVHLLALYQHCCRYNLEAIGSNKFKSTLAFTRSVILIHQIMADVQVQEIGPRRAPLTGVSFYFGGQMKAGQRLKASAYIEALTQHVQELQEPERKTLEAIAKTVFRQLTHTRLGT